ncbi:hypothetical protein D9758_005138 [Tetrapyrgos nigripes]|uniref:Uncharacterized protein n=1 Tax=Tetrapyrgos nigripes TaxID=182062 RepID=A0A8H5LWD8_9AGAR|nr:hypothetical protein D9758_005138 [Tetrapyrgos nigripes]
MTSLAPLFPVEIMEMIFTYLSEETCQAALFNGLEVPTPESRQDLLSCALSNSILFDHAIRILWRNVELLPLLKLLPDFSELEDGSYALTGNVAYNDNTLKRFDFYSRKVRRLVLFGHDESEESSASVQIPESTQRRLNYARPNPLPLLTHLYCSAQSFYDKSAFMVSPFLKSASFNQCSVWDVMMFLFYVDQDRKAPMLHSLTVTSSYDGDEDLLPSILEVDLQNLRHFNFSLSDLDLPIKLDLRLLSHLLHLDELTIDVHGTMIDGVRLLDGSLNSPRALRRLTLHLDDQNASLASTIFQIFQNSPIEHLSIVGSLETEQHQAVFAAIPSLWAQTLTFVVVENHFHPSGDYSPQPLSDFIASMYALRGLERLELLGLENSFYSSDADISNICNAWPNLTTLALETATSSEVAGQLPTEASLEVISRLCPRLRVLKFPLDVLYIPFPSIPSISKSKPNSNSSSPALVSTTAGGGATTAQCRRQAHRLEYLLLDLDECDFHACNSKDKHLAPLVYHLDNGFPYLKEVDVRYEVGDLGGRSWEAVQHALEFWQGNRRWLRRRGVSWA